jgi:hypothetical protein
LVLIDRVLFVGPFRRARGATRCCDRGHAVQGGGIVSGGPFIARQESLVFVTKALKTGDLAYGVAHAPGPRKRVEREF